MQIFASVNLALRGLDLPAVVERFRQLIPHKDFLTGVEVTSDTRVELTSNGFEIHFDEAHALAVWEMWEDIHYTYMVKGAAIGGKLHEGLQKQARLIYEEVVDCLLDA